MPRSIVLFTYLSLLCVSGVSAWPKFSRDLSLMLNDGDPSAFTWLKNFAALGDSYASGINAGTKLGGNGDSSCYRYNGAYPYLLQTMALGVPSDFNFAACRGADTGAVSAQIDKLADNSLDLVTISNGGNDLGLVKLLEDCIYWTTGQAHCDETIKATQATIDRDLMSKTDDMLQKLGPKMRQGNVVIFTLYAQFFNADTDECSSQSWDWVKEAGGLKLTKELRKSLNDLVLAANTKLKAAIASQTSSSRPSRLNIATVDWDGYVGDNKGRFCEEGRMSFVN